jgi:ribonuclease PH
MQDSIDLPMRSVSARLGVLGRADGSCHWNQGDTSVIVAVWGPSAPKRGSNALSDRAFVDIRIIEDINDNVNQNSNLEGRDNPVGLKADIFNVFKSVLIDSLHPRCQISIVIQVVSDDGSVCP